MNRLLASIAPLFSGLLLIAHGGCGGSSSTGGTAPAVELSAARIVVTPGNGGVLVLRGTADTGATVEVSGLPEGVTSSVTEAEGADIQLRIEAAQTALASESVLSIVVESGGTTSERAAELSVQVPQVPDGEEAYAPGVEGVVQTIELDGEQVEVEVIDGLAIAQGDLVIGPIDALTDGESLRAITCPNWSTGFTCDRWTDGVVGYSFADDWGSATENERMRGIIEDAMDHWEENTGIRFVRRASGQWLEFRDGGGCSSNVGRASITGFDSQSISLNNRGCDHFGIAVHEIGHAIGVYHEQSRDDRDDWVVVDFGQVRDGKLHNFFQWGGLASDVGEYNYGSIMHYRASDFARDVGRCTATDDSGCTIRPLRPLPSGLAAIGQRNALSEGDILSAYSLYPPSFSIVGATDGETSDTFSLRVVFDTPTSASTWPRVTWTSDAAMSALGSGQILELDASTVDSGPQTITASFIVDGITIESQSMSINLQNEAPVVMLDTDDGALSQPLGVLFTVHADVSDDFDGSCPDDVCAYAWDPEPDFGSLTSSSANFILGATGPQTITATVTDSASTSGSGSLTVNIVNDAPTATIVSPASDVELPEGVTLGLAGEAEDVNREGGTLGCEALTWSSSAADDTFSPSATGCNPTVAFEGVGTRTISLVATDSNRGMSEADSIEVTVTACDGNCLPTAFVDLTTEPATVFNGAPLYFIEWMMELEVSIAEADGPADGPVDYTLGIREVGSATTTTVASGSLPVVSPSTPATITITWTPDDGIAPWPNCAALPRDHEFILQAEDASGGVSEAFILPVVLSCEFI